MTLLKNRLTNFHRNGWNIIWCSFKTLQLFVFSWCSTHVKWSIHTGLCSACMLSLCLYNNLNGHIEFSQFFFLLGVLTKCLLAKCCLNKKDVVTIKTTFNQDSFRSSADAKFMLNDLVCACLGSACILSLCEYYNLYGHSEFQPIGWQVMTALGLQMMLNPCQMI